MFPVGENEAHKIGDVWPGPRHCIKCDEEDRGLHDTSPESVEEHRVAGLTRNTDCGEQWTTNTSSSVNA